MVWGGSGVHPGGGFPPLCQNFWHQRAETFLFLILTYGPLFSVAFVNISPTVLPWQHFCWTEVDKFSKKCRKTPLFWLNPSKNQLNQLNPSKNKKVGIWPQKQRMTYYSEPLMTSSILLLFWIEFVTYFHTAKFSFNWPSNNGNKEPPHTLWIL